MQKLRARVEQKVTAAGLFFCYAGLLVLLTKACVPAAGEESQLPTFTANVPIEQCEGNLWSFNGEAFVCEPAAERAGTLLAQRDFHFKASEVYRTQRDACNMQLQAKDSELQAQQLARQMADAQERAVEKCRQQGKRFNAETVKCEGELPQPEEPEEP